MTDAPSNPTDTDAALALFDALCELRLSDFIDDQVLGALTDALAVSGRAADLVTGIGAPVRNAVLAKLGSEPWTGKVGDAIPSGVLELLVALLPQLPPLPRKEVERALGSPAVRTEVRRVLEDTVRELMSRISGGAKSLGVLGWGARAATAAGKGIFGALGADVESRIGDAVEFGVGLAQKRLVDLVSSPETARRVGKELATLLPKLADVPDRMVVESVRKMPHPLIDGLVASTLAHNAGRPVIRALVVEEGGKLVERLSATSVGVLLDRFGPARAAARRDRATRRARGQRRARQARTVSSPRERARANIDVVIPALDEELAVGGVVAALLPHARSVIVVDNGSRDRTAEVARAAGAVVVAEPRRGYGAACLAGIAALPRDCDIVVFVDADGSDEPSELPALVQPIVEDRADLVIGSRSLGHVQRGALTPQQRVGNAIAATWLRARFGLPATDLGPFRAIRRSSLAALGMVDTSYGWTVEMQIKAAQQGLRYAEVPAAYKVRLGVSKVSGTLRGVLGASYKILGLLAWYDLRGRRR